MTDAAGQPIAVSRRTGAIRIAIGFAQGLALWLLMDVAEPKGWPATQPGLFGALAMVAMFTPFVLLGGLGSLRPRTLGIWAVFATAVLAALGLHDLVRRGGVGDGDLWVSWELISYGGAGLFIAHHLVEGGDAERKLIARYVRYFDAAWKHGVQIVLSAGFVGVFWLVLYLGAALFNLIGIKFVGELLEKSWFNLPATATMFAAAVHLTDVRSGLIRGIRTVALTLLSWLLPVLTVLIAAFLCALPFTGLDPLWKTRSAAGILLSAAAVLIVLINAAYQDGEPDGVVPIVLRIAGRLAGWLLLPLVGIAIYALWLRIGQHGLTPDRIVAAACALIGAVYAVGYAWAAVRLGRWMRRLEVTNVVAAFVTLAVLLALFSPLADPARLSVNDQMTRLEHRQVTPDRFDYAFLRFEGERYGLEALKALKAKGGVAGGKAAILLARKNRWEGQPTAAEGPPVAGDIRTLNLIWPAGAAFSRAFLANGWLAGDAETMGCTVETPCTAALLDLNADQEAEVVVVGKTMVVVLSRAGQRDWWSVMQTDLKQCPGIVEDMKAGRLSAEPSAWRDLVIGGKRIGMDPKANDCDSYPSGPRARIGQAPPTMERKGQTLEPITH